MRKRSLLIVVLFCLPVISACTAFAQSGDVPRMTKEALRPVMGKPEVVIIDVRTGMDWTASDMKIKGAVREDPEALPLWASKYSKDKTLVFYCA